jgi:choline dehydrogenase-like flavoprotein
MSGSTGDQGRSACRTVATKHPLVDRFVEAGIQAGQEHNDDFNGASQLGVGRLQFTMRDSSRCSARTHIFIRRGNGQIWMS